MKKDFREAMYIAGYYLSTSDSKKEAFEKAKADGALAGEFGSTISDGIRCYPNMARDIYTSTNNN